MKFKVRDGLVVHLVTEVEVSEGKFEKQTNSYYGGQLVELDEAQANEHLHKLEAFKDREAVEFLAGKVLPAAPGAALGLSAETTALVEALTSKMAAAILGAIQQKASGEQVQTPAPGAE
jgi:hypothetical protein